jgi:hypothetical protein
LGDGDEVRGNITQQPTKPITQRRKVCSTGGKLLLVSPALFCVGYQLVGQSLLLLL